MLYALWLPIALAMPIDPVHLSGEEISVLAPEPSLKGPLSLDLLERSSSISSSKLNAYYLTTSLLSTELAIELSIELSTSLSLDLFTVSLEWESSASSVTGSWTSNIVSSVPPILSNFTYNFPSLSSSWAESSSFSSRSSESSVSVFETSTSKTSNPRMSTSLVSLITTSSTTNLTRSMSSESSASRIFSSSATLAFPSTISKSSSSLNPASISTRISSTSGSSSLLSSSSTSKSLISQMPATASSQSYSGDLFKPIMTEAPPSVFSKTKWLGTLPIGVNRTNRQFQTNKFYTNMLVDGQNNTVWTYPYNLFYSPKGMGISTTNITKRVFSYSGGTDAPTTFSNPTLVALVVLGLLSIPSELRISDPKMMSVTSLIVYDSSSYIEFPLVEGMGMVTAIYHGITLPVILTDSIFDSFTGSNGTYTVSVNGVKWMIYVIGDCDLSINDGKTQIFGTKGNVTIQVAILDTYSEPSVDVAEVYSKSVGTYPTEVALKGTLVDGVFNYAFEYQCYGLGSPLIFLLPHHIGILSLNSSNTGVQLYSATKGIMTAFQASSIQFTAKPLDLGFMPKGASYLPSQKQILQETLEKEMNAVQFNIATLIEKADTYTMGKIIDKYSYMMLVLAMAVQNTTLTEHIFAALEEAWKLILENRVLFPLYQLADIGGISVIVGGGECYLANMFNDHHFHYGYLVHSAAVMSEVASSLGKPWLTENIKVFVNLLIRDVANPLDLDAFFPQFRMFDWYHGHSFALGLIASGDGRNQESSSEDYNFAYGMKLWAKVTGDGATEATADLMLALTQKSLSTYYYISKNNSAIPSVYAPHMVPGILYENKLTYVTFFGTEPQYIHGIHMLPITPASVYMRLSSFVEAEWEKFGFEELVGSTLSRDPWGHILKLNQALCDPHSSLQHFTPESFDLTSLDNGQSLTWSLAFAMALS